MLTGTTSWKAGVPVTLPLVFIVAFACRLAAGDTTLPNHPNTPHF